MIKYHQNGVEREYGEDGVLTNNWDPDKDYGTEYANVYFRMTTKGYEYPLFLFSEEAGEAFDKELAEVFTALGWECKETAYNGRCSTWTKGKSHLYMHPQNFSGEVLKNEIKEIAEAIEKRETFFLRWVDLYKTIYDITDEEYMNYLESKKKEIRKLLFKFSSTTRTSKFYHLIPTCKNVGNKVGLPRIGFQNIFLGHGIALDYILKVAEEMIEEGLLVAAEKDGIRLVRSLNKTEQKKKKIKVA